jgi:hypothetical protein
MTTFATRETREMPLDDLDPAPYNPRDRLSPDSDAYTRLRESLLTYGNVQPIVVNVRDGKNTIVGGHQRYWILKDDLGEMQDRVVVVDLDEEYEMALNLALNNPAGSYVGERLAPIVERLESFELLSLAQMVDYDSAAVIASLDASAPPPPTGATDFLGDLDVDSAVTSMASVGAPELKADHPHRTGEQYFNMQLVFTAEQRAIFLSAIDAAKEAYALSTTMEAIVAICKQFLIDQGVET